jgi:hypothetical protein
LPRAHTVKTYGDGVTAKLTKRGHFASSRFKPMNWRHKMRDD